jgi:hypothetical protein
MINENRTTWLAIAAISLFAASFMVILIITGASEPSAASMVQRTLLGLAPVSTLLVGEFAVIQQWWTGTTAADRRCAEASASLQTVEE